MAGLKPIYYYRSKLNVDRLDTTNDTTVSTSQSGIYDKSLTYIVGDFPTLFNNPYGVAVDTNGNVFVADKENNRIRKVTPRGVVTTLAGSTNGFADGSLSLARFNSPRSVAVDSSGNVFVADYFNHRIRKVTEDGVVTTLAGSGSPAFADGTGTSASFSYPSGVAVDSSGNLFVADFINHRIRKIIISSGVVSTLAGDGDDDGNGNGRLLDAPSGPATSASFFNPTGVAVDNSGNVFVADMGNHSIRKVTPGGAVTTLAGNGNMGAPFSYPSDVAVDTSGNVIVADRDNERIRKVTQGGVVTTLAGSGNPGFADAPSGPGSVASFSSPNGVAVDSSGNVFVTDIGNAVIRKVTPAGVVTTIAGTPTVSGYEDAPFDLSNITWIIGWNSTGNKTRADQVTVTKGTVLDASGTYFLYPSASGNDMYYFASEADASGCLINSVLNIAATVTKSLGVSRNYTVGNLDAMFKTPAGVAVDTNGNIFVADKNNQRIRKVTPSGVVTTLAGSGNAAFADGTGTGASFYDAWNLTLDSSGNVFVSDYSNNRIRKIVISSGVVTTLAGSGNAAFADGTGASASFNTPNGVAVDSSGNVIVVDQGNHRIRKVTPGGVVTTLAGSGSPAFADGTGTAASFSYPGGVAVDSSGNVIVSDAGNNRIRKVTPGGVVTTLAGSTSGFLNGTGASAKFISPRGVAVDSSGNVFVADSQNNRIRKVTPGGVVTTLAGNGVQGFADGIGTDASFYYPYGVALDSSGNVIVGDNNTNRIRKINITTGAVTTLAGAEYGFKDNNITLPSSQWRIASNSPGNFNINSNVDVTSTGNPIFNARGTYFLYPSAVCFLEGTTVLSFVDGNEEYVPVEKLTKDSLVKTLRDGYQKIDMIAKQELFNPGTNERIEQRLYKCSSSRYPELTSDLYLTGCHSILVDTITDDERVKLTKQLGRIFVTDKKYRLTACVDERAEPWNSEGTYTVWHFALEHENILMNYGVFVNGGLLVESCSKHVLKNKSDMVLL